MASTNKTTHYELSQFISSDIPAWLVDYNGDMNKIDTGIAQSKTTADTASQTADTAIANAQNAQETANTAVTNAAAADSKATTATTNIGTMAELETVDKTSLVGAINEINENLTDVEGAINTLVVDSLSGNETDKAPSVKAVNDKTKVSSINLSPISATSSTSEITIGTKNIDETGIHLITGYADINHYGQSGRNLVLNIKVNGVVKWTYTGVLSNAYTNSTSIAYAQSLNAGDVVTFTVKSSTAVNWSVGGGSVQFTKI